jgi:hypothetical protein
MTMTPLDRLPAFLTWRKATARDQEGIARQQLRDGIIKEIDAECRDGNGHVLLSDGVTVHDVYLIGQWIEQMGGPPLPGALRIQ